MCGIFGYTGFKRSELDIARESLNTLTHRGPDQWNDWYDSNVYIGHRRLSIIDLSVKGKQPMRANDVVIAVNGEIYNYKILKAELKDKYFFESESDSEVILHGYTEWGIDKLVQKIDGMFALCVFDKKTDNLYLVRDRFGKKPLFYVKKENKFLFASEIKALLEFDDELRIFSYQGIKEWVYHRGNHSNSTIFHNIFKVQPGHYLEISKNKIKKIQYYDVIDSINNSNDNGDKFQNTEELIELYLSKAVEKRLMSDVPVGLQLSGGVDSSLISWAFYER